MQEPEDLWRLSNSGWIMPAWLSPFSYSKLDFFALNFSNTLSVSTSCATKLVYNVLPPIRRQPIIWNNDNNSLSILGRNPMSQSASYMFGANIWLLGNTTVCWADHGESTAHSRCLPHANHVRLVACVVVVYCLGISGNYILTSIWLTVKQLGHFFFNM